MPAYPASKRLESLRQQVRMPDGREKGSHHGREKEVFSDVQAAGGRGVGLSAGGGVWFRICIDGS